MTVTRAWELAGMVTEEGLLGKVMLPSIQQPGPPAYLELDKHVLRWSHRHPAPGQPPGQRPRLANSRGMLDQFVRIRDSEDILRFAQRYGVLSICEHLLPNTHPSVGSWVCRPLGDTGLDSIKWEPVAVWLHYSQQARALLNIGASLYRGQPGDPQDWRTVYRWTDAPAHGSPNPVWWDPDTGELKGGPDLTKFDPRWTPDLWQGRVRLAWELERWLYHGNVRVWFDWRGSNPEFGLTGWTFGTLAIQLMMSITRTHSLMFCSGCGAPYLRERRKPKPGEQNFCEQCQGRLAATLRKRRQRAGLSRPRKGAQDGEAWQL